MAAGSFREFSLELLQILQEHWHPARTAQPLRVTIRFKLNRDGSVAFAEVRKSSGDTSFDNAAMGLVQNYAQFPAVPNGVNDNALFAFNFDSADPDLHPSGVPRKQRTPDKESSAQLAEPVEEIIEVTE